jgi:hypothetical protein
VESQGETAVVVLGYLVQVGVSGDELVLGVGDLPHAVQRRDLSGLGSRSRRAVACGRAGCRAGAAVGDRQRASRGCVLLEPADLGDELPGLRVLLHLRVHRSEGAAQGRYAGIGGVREAGASGAQARQETRVAVCEPGGPGRRVPDCLGEPGALLRCEPGESAGIGDDGKRLGPQVDVCRHESSPAPGIFPQAVVAEIRLEALDRAAVQFLVQRYRDHIARRGAERPDRLG